MRFVLIRHSKTDRDPKVPITRWGLSDEGIELAKELSQDKIIKGLDVIYTSLQTKAIETALLIAKPNHIAMKVDDRLTEVTSFTGAFEKDFDIYTKNVHDYYSGSIERIGEGETKTEALDRFIQGLESIAEIEDNKTYVGIITHGNILALFAALYKDVDSYELHMRIKQPDVAIFDWNEKKFDNFYGE